MPLAAAAVGGLIGIAVVAAAQMRRPAASTSAGDRRIVRFSFEVPTGLNMPAGFNANVGISRDGQSVAYTPLGGPVMLRRIDELESHPLDGAKTPGFYRAPVFSPDGRFVSFIDGDAIYSA
jgi:hypothetical protein